MKICKECLEASTAIIEWNDDIEHDLGVCRMCQIAGVEVMDVEY